MGTAVRSRAWTALWLAAASCCLAACERAATPVAKPESTALALCRQREGLAKMEAADWKARHDTEKLRSDALEALEAQQTATMPEIFRKIHAEQAELVNQLPQAVRIEVQRRLDKPLVAASREFDRLHKTNDQLEELTRRLKSQQTRHQTMLDEQQRQLSQAAPTEAAKRALEDRIHEVLMTQQDLANDLVDVTEKIVDFDKTRVTCRPACSSPLKLNDATKQQLAAFHDQLVDRLQAIRTRIGHHGL